MAIAPEPRLEALREQLALARARGEPFGPAWEQARAEVLAGLSQLDRRVWVHVLVCTRGAWRAAYYRSSTRGGGAMTELEAFAADGELEPLRYELPAA